MQNSLSVEGRFRPVMGVAPINITGAGKASPWINMGQGKKVRFALLQGAWAGGTAAVTVTQASDNAGTGEKAVAFTKIWQATISGQTLDVLAEVAVTSNTFNLSTAGVLTIIEIQAGDLDTNNAFNFVRINTATPGSNADLLAILVDLYDCHVEAKPATLVSILA